MGRLIPTLLDWYDNLQFFITSLILKKDLRQVMEMMYVNCLALAITTHICQMLSARHLSTLPISTYLIVTTTQ